jgi:hypothetical protein
VHYQLRRYRVQDGRLDEFVELWHSQVAPLRRSFGFVVVGAWTLEESNEFVWVIGHDSFQEADDRYYNSPERAAMSPNPADLLAAVSHWMMDPVPGAVS